MRGPVQGPQGGFRKSEDTRPVPRPLPLPSSVPGPSTCPASRAARRLLLGSSGLRRVSVPFPLPCCCVGQCSRASVTAFLQGGQLCVCLVVSDSFMTPLTVAHMAPLSFMRLPRQEHCVSCHFLSAGDLPTQGLNPHLLHCRWIL